MVLIDMGRAAWQSDKIRHLRTCGDPNGPVIALGVLYARLHGPNYRSP
jgi:hypothetical protein